MPTDNLTRSEAQTRAQLISDLKYDVELSLDDSAGPVFESTSDITFICAEDHCRTFVDIKAQRIISLTVNGEDAEASDRTFDGHRLLVAGLTRGPNRVRIEAACEYNNNGEGLHRFVDPEDGAVYMWSQSEPFSAHHFFPCFDQPDLKAHFTLAVTAPAGWAVVSNNPPEHEQPAVGGRRRHRFGVTEALPTYLMHVSAGPYAAVHDSHSGIPMALYCRESLTAYLDPAEIFEITRNGLDWFASIFGYSYPFAKYDQLFVPQFNWGAMENPGAVTFNEMYVPRGAVTDAFRARRANTILHEMGHVFGFGNVVTMRWWEDLWLNESFAEWVAVTAVFETTRFHDCWADFTNTRKVWAARQDQLPSTHPISGPIPDTQSVRLLFDGISYAKGASAIKQLVAWVDRDRFLDGLRSYVADHRWANASLGDFLGAIERSSGRDLRQWSREWLETAGINTLRAQVDTALHHITGLTISQTAAPSNPQLRSHRVAIGLYHLTPAGKLERRRRIEVDVTGPVTEVTDRQVIGSPAPDLVLVNDDDLTYAKLRFDERSLATVIDHLGALESALARSLCWATVWDMTRDAELPSRDFVEMVARHAPGEPQVAVLEQLLVHGVSAISQFADDDAGHRRRLRRRLRDAVHSALGDAAPVSGHQLALTRAFISLADTDDDLAWIERLIDGNESIAGVTMDTELRWHILGRLASAGCSGSPDRVAAELTRDRSDIGERRAAAAIASQPSAEVKAQVWERIVGNAEMPLATLRTVLNGYGSPGVAGFSQPDQGDLLAPYIDQYFASLPGFWAERDLETAIEFTRSAFPQYTISDEVLARTTAALANPLLSPEQSAGAGQPSSPAQRLLIEARDGVERARRAQAADRAAMPAGH